MKHIDIKGYLEAANDSDEAWNVANDKLLEFETKLKELEVIKGQIKVLLDNTSMGTEQLRSLIMDLERYYVCLCGELEDHTIHNSIEPMHKDAHAFTNAHDYGSEDE